MTNFSNLIFDKSIIQDISSPEVGFDEDEIGKHMTDYDTASSTISYTAMTEQTTKSGPIQDAVELSQIMFVRKVMTGIVIPIFYFFLVVIGMVGNTVVIYVSFFLTRKSKNAVDIFVGNLAIADLALIMTLPFWATANLLNGTWIFGDAACKILSFLTNINMFASIFLITAMAVDRYTLVVKAVKVQAKSLRTLSRVRWSCVLIWAISVLLSLPSAILRQTVLMRNDTFCSWVYPKDYTKFCWGLHIVTRNVIAFVIPVSIICRCYWVIVSYVRTRRNSNRNRNGPLLRENHGDGVKDRQSRRVNRLVTAIILAFVICWLPNQVSNFCQSLIFFKVLHRPESRYGSEVIYLIHVFTTVLSFTNSTINPVIYSTSPSHRMHIKMVFYRVFRCCKSGAERKRVDVDCQLPKNSQVWFQRSTTLVSCQLNAFCFFLAFLLHEHGLKRGDCRNTDVTLLSPTTGLDSPKTSEERVSQVDRRGNPVQLNSPILRFPTNVEGQQISRSTPTIENNLAETAPSGDDSNVVTVLLSGSKELDDIDGGQEHDKLLRDEADFPETVL